MQASKLLPLGDLIGMTMQRVTYEATIALEVLVKHTSFVHDSALQKIAQEHKLNIESEQFSNFIFFFNEVHKQS